jgi:WhiB family redox-sensing transcriptional regulator
MRFDRDAPGAKLVLEIDAITHDAPLDLDKLETNTQRNHTAALRRKRSGGARKAPDQTFRLILGKEADVQAPGPWLAEGACRGRHDRMCYAQTNVIAERPGRFQQQTEVAVAICMTCPVLQQCRNWALTTPDPAVDHVAGGLTPWERRNIRKQHLKALPDDTR